MDSPWEPHPQVWLQISFYNTSSTLTSHTWHTNTKYSHIDYEISKTLCLKHSVVTHSTAKSKSNIKPCTSVLPYFSLYCLFILILIIIINFNLLPLPTLLSFRLLHWFYFAKPHIFVQYCILYVYIDKYIFICNSTTHVIWYHRPNYISLVITHYSRVPPSTHTSDIYEISCAHLPSYPPHVYSPYKFYVTVY